MSDHLFTADLHLGHEFVAKERGFRSTEEHDERIISGLQKAVRKHDTLWILGDYSMSMHRYARRLLASLPCRKNLIPGNHDPEHPMHRSAWKRQREALDVFDAVLPFARVRLQKTNFLMSHLPYHSNRVSPIEPGPEWRETDAPGYFANQDGQIRGRQGRILKPWIAGRGYEYVSVPTSATTKQNRTVHSLVCSAFHGARPEGAVVAHGDGNPLNNRASNLRWATPAENAADRIAHGTGGGGKYSMPGEENPSSSLTWADVSFIRESDATPLELAEQFGISRSNIYKIKRGETWNASSAEVLGGDHKPEERHTQYRLPNEGMPLLCGHVHDAWKFNGNQFNVGVDVNDFLPVSAQTVIDWWKVENDGN